MNRINVGFIGAGPVGTALAVALSKAGYHIAEISSRTVASANKLSKRLPKGTVVVPPTQMSEKCDLVFITTSDSVIREVVSDLILTSSQAAVHCSAVYNLDVLDKVAGVGAATGSFHPLFTFPRHKDRKRFTSLPQGVTFAVEGKEWVRKTLEEMAFALGGRSITIPPQYRSLYHASAVLTCGYLVTLIKSATELRGIMGFTQEEALKGLLLLAKSTLRNIDTLGPEESLTGPISRGDAAVVQMHLDALANSMPGFMSLYSSLGLHSLRLSSSRMRQEDIETLKSLLSDTLYRN